MTLSAAEIERYARHVMVREIGGAGQQALRAASVSIIGAGALGGPCALYLAAAGIGRIEIIDDDRVDTSNLTRQVQFDAGDVGAAKSRRLAERLAGLNPHIKATARPERFGDGTDLTGDIIIDATDNFETRFALNRAAHETGRTLVSGAAGIWAGQVSAFASGLDAHAPCYQCLVPEPPPEAADCEVTGVVGPVTGMVGARMALETMKLVTGAGVALVSHLWIFDGLSGRGRVVKVQKDMKCATCGGG